MSSEQPQRGPREEYERLVELGVLGEDEHVELIEGEIVETTPPSPPQATAVLLVQEALRAVFGQEFHVRAQLPLALGQSSEPEPDAAVVQGSPRDFARAHPTSALLVVEVADRTLAHDRDTKGSMYAKAGIPDYWIVNVGQRWSASGRGLSRARGSARRGIRVRIPHSNHRPARTHDYAAR